MARADLHVHSSYSTHPSVWFLQRLGSRECYVEPEEVYQRARGQGMDFVTITDHNQIEGSLLLKERHPDEVVTGVEVTTYFPDESCKVHVLVYGLDHGQFLEIDRIRPSIYDLRDYLFEEDLAHAVAHPTYSVNRKMTVERLERLVLMFDIFEGINGSRYRRDNDVWREVARNLTPERKVQLAEKHGLEPCSDEPWIKGITGGSDDHSGLFVGTTYTEFEASTTEELLLAIKQKRTSAGGRHNDYQGLAFSVYKVAYDFSKSRTSVLNRSVLGTVNDLIFEEKRGMGLRGRFMFGRMKRSRAAREDETTKALIGLVDALQTNGFVSTAEKFEMLHDRVSDMADGFVRSFLTRLSGDVANGDMLSLIRGVSASLPGIFLSLPFFTTVGVLNDSRDLLAQLIERYGDGASRSAKRVLWFTDTLTDLNGVSETLRKLGMLAFTKELDLTLVACLLDGERLEPMPPNILRLPCIHTYTPSFFDSYTLRAPSVLSSVKMICEADPDEIYISTPGPVGLLGMLMAKLLRVPCTGIYHTDFTKQAFEIVGEEAICSIIEDYTRWFYSLMTTVAVPTEEYISLLADRGFDRGKMVKFRRGIDPVVFSPRDRFSRDFPGMSDLSDGTTLLYCGRVSKEKNVDFLGSVYKQVHQNNRAVNLVLAGDGSYYEEFRGRMRPFHRVVFLGRVDRHRLPELYSLADLFVFPSTTDTFGMVVLEAQACGLPAVVTDVGGPKEIIVPGKTGFVARAGDPQDWTNKIEGIISLRTYYPELYQEFRLASRQNVLNTYHWDLVLQDVFGPQVLPGGAATPQGPALAHDNMALLER